ncbi:MAG TPA: flagellar hook basal-body protein [Coleofasciculaceae cyanobacterium]|jgi:flagellar basal-body rod protein FlgG
MIDHIMKLAATNANKQFEVLEQISINVANINTTGYKTKRFEQYLTPDGRLDGSVRVDTAQGNLMLTNNKFDFAVDGFGYIPVTQPDGTVAYTRDGSFTLNSQGYLTTQRGDIIGDGVKVPIDYKDIKIWPDGSIKVRTVNKPDEDTMIGKLSLVRFPNPEGLKNIGYNKLVANDQSGEPIEDTDSKVKQGMLERANVFVPGQIDSILRLNAGVIANMRVVKFSDDLFRQAVNLKQ